MRRTFLAAAIALVALAACSLPTVDNAADAKARGLYEQIRTGADLSQSPDLAPDLKTPAALAQLAAVKAMLPPGAPTAATNRSWSINAGTGGTTATLVHAYSYPTQTVLAQTVLAKGRDKTWKITGLHVTFEERSTSPEPADAVTVTKRPQTT
ncbi:MAG: hypothetical protein HY859_01060 [Caulobacterales bacterium]|nr:hypothetical protein [Caulobacterales bacterium]